MKAKARKQLADRVRSIRVRRGWSQEVLAELSGLNRSYIGAIERAEHNIGLDNIERIASALEIRLAELLDDSAVLPECARSTPEPDTPVSQPVVIHRKLFLELLHQCGETHRELVLVYLERCGVIIRE
ncbi:MAG TPA: XRE family transcriptional regulator [Gammaproteobacteria bacterium]|nr:XRE family transcriptional regulator [Gammaproteobacteria bacterium]